MQQHITPLPSTTHTLSISRLMYVRDTQGVKDVPVTGPSDCQSQ